MNYLSEKERYYLILQTQELAKKCGSFSLLDFYKDKSDAELWAIYNRFKEKSAEFPETKSQVIHPEPQPIKVHTTEAGDYVCLYMKNGEPISETFYTEKEAFDLGFQKKTTTSLADEKSTKSNRSREAVKRLKRKEEFYNKYSERY